MATRPRQLTTERLQAAYASQVQATRTTAVAMAVAYFLHSQSFRDEDAATFAKAIAPIISAARKRVSALTDAYLSRVLTAETGRKVPSKGPIDTDVLRNDLPLTEEYLRPYRTVWRDLGEGKTLDEAVEAAETRLTSLVETDMQLAKTHTAQNVLKDEPAVVGYERTLTGDVNCGLCVVASTKFYTKADLMPIHPGCDCGVRPVTDRSAFRADVDGRLEDAHDAIEKRFGRSDAGGRSIDYRKLLLTQEHGELGPVLTVAGHHFTGPEAVKSGLDLTDLPRI